MKTCKLHFDVTYDPSKTNATKLAELFDFMIGQSLCGNVLDDQGETNVGTVTAEESNPLILTDDDASELYYSFNRRGYSLTRVKVAEFLRQVQMRKGARVFGWYAEITIKADDENNAIEFWQSLDEQFPAIAKELRDNDQASIDAETWNAIQSLKGFSDGPEFARNALVVVES